MNRITIALTTALLTLSGCGSGVAAGNVSGPPTGNRLGDSAPPRPPETQFGPEEPMSGTFTTGFEISRFNDCWLGMDQAAAEEFQRLFPPRQPHSGRWGTFRMEIIGRRAIDTPGQPPSYGHLGAARCEIRAVRIVSASEIGRDPSAPDEGAGKDSGFGVGHDQTRLDDIQRNLPPPKK